MPNRYDLRPLKVPEDYEGLARLLNTFYIPLRGSFRVAADLQTVKAAFLTKNL